MLLKALAFEASAGCKSDDLQRLKVKESLVDLVDSDRNRRRVSEAIATGYSLLGLENWDAFAVDAATLRRILEHLLSAIMCHALTAAFEYRASAIC